MFLFFLAFIAICVIVMLVGSAKKGRISDRLAERKMLTSDSFISTWDYSFIALNFDTKQIALGREDTISIYDFSKIIQVDLLRDDNTITSTTKNSPIARAFVGGVLLGGVGAVVGAASAGSQSHSTQIPKSICLRVITESGSHSIYFLRWSGTSKSNSDSLISHISQQADNFYAAVLKAIRLAEKASASHLTTQRENILSLIETRATTSQTSRASEIDQLWQLKEKGAISFEEYEKAKRSLL